MNCDLSQKLSSPYERVEVECAICLEEVEDHLLGGKEQSAVLDCSHLFHKECLDYWLTKQLSCPLCRAVVKKIDQLEIQPAPINFIEVPVIAEAQHSNFIFFEGITHTLFRSEQVSLVLQQLRSAHIFAMRFFSQCQY